MHEPVALCLAGIPNLVQQLQARGKAVFLVSGGFRAIINPIAKMLGIPLENVFANTILFDGASGAYAGFDAAEFTSRSGGKAAAILAIKVHAASMPSAAWPLRCGNTFVARCPSLSVPVCMRCRQNMGTSPWSWLEMA